MLRDLKKWNEKKWKMWTSQLCNVWSMDWCGERPFGHRASDHTFYNNFLAVISKTIKKETYDQWKINTDVILN